MKLFSRLLLLMVAVLCAFVCLYPVALMLLSSLKTNAEIFAKPMGLPSSLSLASYTQLLEQLPYFGYVKNSAIVSIASVCLTLACGSSASFYIARFQFPWNGALFFYFLMGMMIPMKLGIIPLFLFMRNLGLLGSLWSLIWVYTAIGIPISVLILSRFFRTMPRELEEAARIDGASNLSIFWHILLPVMKPALGTVTIIHFITVWNDFFFPLIFIHDEAKKTIPVGMLTLFSEYSTDWSVLFAGLTLSSLPMLLLFFAVSKQFMEGITAGAVK
ncbi:sugar ABC transporter permease [candidate division KSB3 bacterium]|uniref:Sugar ABC transporter permease n=1 Tax=candidate division KSB3 bacterium TaxID=2044937 RepID=A0A2G6E344_9BACT|nr:MAG: sugar ABC transporter permease [candidate division KSB3 bacterium]PIE29099.1 MAG: sugar ABC transporter permease [candidate division KSB3 bacterium]